MSLFTYWDDRDDAVREQREREWLEPLLAAARAEGAVAERKRIVDKITADNRYANYSQDRETQAVADYVTRLVVWIEGR